VFDIANIIQTTLSKTNDSGQLSAAIFGIVLTLDCKNVLELGVRDGETTFPLLGALKLTGGNLTSVDIDATSFECPPSLSEQWTFIQEDALSFLENDKGHYDLVYIDDWHDGIHVAKELQLLINKIDKRTIVLLHDLMHTGTHPNYNTSSGMGEFANGGPYAAVKGLNPEEWEFATLPVSHGLTILRRRV
jgi:predicted O-methyltransferase YrrM